MAVIINDIKWFTFNANTADPDGIKGPKTFAGPAHLGTKAYVLPKDHDAADRIIAVTTAVESGHYDAINMYDRAVISVGLIQFIESNQFSVSDLLGGVAEKCGINYVLTILKPALEISQATFRKNEKNQWRFAFLDGRGEVNTLAKVRQLYLGCNGLKKSWTPETVMRAKTWATCIANIWASEEARKVQIEFTRKRLHQFIGLNAKAVLFDATPNEGYVEMIRAAYLSFAINSPLFADLQIKKANANLKSPKWSLQWCIGVLKQLTFGSGIAFWPVRYNSIRPVLEKLWAVELPQTAKELSTWKEEIPVTIIEKKEEQIVEPTKVQEPIIVADTDFFDDEEPTLPNIKFETYSETLKKETEQTQSVIEQKQEIVPTNEITSTIESIITENKSIGILQWILQIIISIFAAIYNKKVSK